jgi:hypothetical protein
MRHIDGGAQPPPAAHIAHRVSAAPQITIDNTSDASCSTIRVAGPGQSDCLILLVNGLFSEGFKVLSSNYK